MLKTIKNSQYRNAFYAGLFFIVLSFILSGYSDKTVNQALMDKTDFITFMLMAVFVAPVLEEFTFRSFLTEKPVLFGLAMFLLVLSGLGSIATDLSHLVVCVIGIWAIYNHRKKRSHQSLWIAIIMSSLFFAQGHYSVGYSLHSFLDFAYMQLGIGFIFSWIVINYKLMYSMIAHAAFNALLMLLAFLGVQVIMEPPTTIGNENLQIVYTQVPFFGAEASKSERISNLLWEIKSASINELKTQITALSNDSTEVSSRIPFAHYNFVITSMNGRKIKAREVYEILEENDFISIGEN